MRPSNKSRSRNKSGNLGGNPNNINNQNRRNLGNIINRVFESAGPDGKVRGTPQQIIDKYLALARDAQLSGDRVAAESFLQHAEHYSRLLGEAQRAQQESRQGGFEREDGRGDDARDELGRPMGGFDQDRPRQQSQPQPQQHAQPQQPPRQEERYSPPPVDSSGLATIDTDDEGDGGLIETPESHAFEPRESHEAAPAVNGTSNGMATEPVAPAQPKRGRPRRKAPRPEADAAPLQAE
jgi:hypothetical protein